MKTITLKNLFLSGLCLSLVACGTEISESLDDDADPGSADFSTFVAVGDSLTAGYKDGALYREGQQNSYPAILAQQFARAGGGAFAQPLMPVGATGSLTLAAAALPVSDRLILAPTGNPSSPVSPTPIMPAVSTEIGVPLIGPFNNIGVPGAKSFHLTAPSYGDATGVIAMTANPFFVRFRSAAATSVIADAAFQAPSFFILWIGNNDILLYALSGADGIANPPYGLTSTDVTDPAVFTPAYLGALGALKLPTNKGVLVNVPDIGTIPYFTTVPYNPIPMSASDAAAANDAYVGYNGALLTAEAGMVIDAAERAQRTITFNAIDSNPVIILDESLTNLGAAVPNLRQATAEDLIILPASPKIGTESVPGNPATIWGVGTALEDGDVVTEFEIGLIETARTAYNATIKAAADGDPDLVLFDAAAKLEELNTTGILYGSGGVSSTFVQGGAFSADGVHPTARGYAVIANEIMKVIEDGFGAKLPPVNPSDYSTVFFQ